MKSLAISTSSFAVSLSISSMAWKPMFQNCASIDLDLMLHQHGYKLLLPIDDGVPAEPNHRAPTKLANGAFLLTLLVS